MLKGMFERRSETFHVSQTPPGWIVKGYGNETFTGEYITPEGSLNVSAVLAAFTILSEDISSLPLILYRRLERGKERATNHPYYRLMHDTPNPEHTSMIFRELMMGHLLGWGNFYGQEIWDRKGQVVEIWPLDPSRMEVARKNGRRIYLYRLKSGQERAFTQDEILHIPAFGFNGLVGFSRITLARNAIGLAQATEKFGSKFFANDARPSIALKYPGALKTQAARDNILNSWNAIYQGVDRSHGTALLEEGLDIKEIGIPPEDAQFLETRKFQVTEIARIFRVPPHMIGDVERSTSWGSGIDSQEQGYVSHTLRPWMVRTEQQLNKDILLEEERKDYFYEHLVDGLLRGDLATRYEGYVKAITNGWMNPNEVRDRENLNPYAGGDEYLRPLNMTTTGKTDGQAPAGGKLQKARSSLLEPLYRDAAQRVIKREMNDLHGAVRRYLAKNQVEAFEKWCHTFYEQDHPEFVRRQFEPVLMAQRAVGGLEELDFEGIDAVFEIHFTEQQERALALAVENTNVCEETIERWSNELPEKLTSEILRAILEEA